MSSDSLHFDAINHCIYCGASDVKLGREHVMPFGMQGRMVLPKSSCDKCSLITGRIENFVLGRMLIDLRIRYGLKSRKGSKNQRPKGFDVTVENVFTKYKKTKKVNNDYLPWVAYSLPKYNLPGLLLSISPEESKKGATLECIVSKFDAENMLALGEGPESVGLKSQVINMELFNRFLAKIAHSYLVATIGEDAFAPCLKDLIIEGHKHTNFWVGCEDPQPAEPFLFEMRHGLYTYEEGPWKGTSFVAVRIRLFSFLGTPTYVVVGGERRCNEDWFFKQPAYALPAKVLIKGADGEPLFSCGV